MPNSYMQCHVEQEKTDNIKVMILHPSLSARNQTSLWYNGRMWAAFRGERRRVIIKGHQMASGDSHVLVWEPPVTVHLTMNVKQWYNATWMPFLDLLSRVPPLRAQVLTCAAGHVLTGALNSVLNRFTAPVVSSLTFSFHQHVLPTVFRKGTREINIL